jgi:PKD repeat protein
MDRLIKTGSLFLSLFMLFSCEEEPPAPEVSFTATVNSNVVSFDSKALNTETYEWNFGDGSSLSNEEDPVHTYAGFNQNYTVSLKVKGRGGEKEATHEVTIPPMTVLQTLSGTDPVSGSKKWRLKATAPIIFTRPDTSFTIIKTYPAAFLTALGFTHAYLDEYIFGSNGSFNIELKGSGVIGSLGYCKAKGIPNVVPSHDAEEANLTLITPFILPGSMTYGFTESKDLTITTSSKGDSGPVTFRKVKTISLSYGAFIGIRGWSNEIIVQDLTASTMKIAIFASSSSTGKVTGVMLLTLEAV